MSWRKAFLIFPTFLEVPHHPMATKAAGKKRMSQSEVVNHFAEKFDLKRAQVKELFEELSNLASNEVRQNGEFQLPGFGKLVLSERKAREGRNPQTGETIQIPAKTALKFRLSKGIKDSVIPKK
jgi:DNA-binding protein HU-beta